jgi:hypothetical protein
VFISACAFGPSGRGVQLDLERMATDNTRVCWRDIQLKEFRPLEYLETVKEFRRSVRRGGRLFLTGLYGRSENHAWLQQRDRMCLIVRDRPGRAQH